jgi:hypothetical protein
MTLAAGRFGTTILATSKAYAFASDLIGLTTLSAVPPTPA